MKDKSKNMVGVVMSSVGILLFLAAGFDLFPAQDNLLVFLGIACFIIAAAIKKL